MEVNEFDFAVEIFNQRGAAFHPVTAIEIFNAVDGFGFGAVDMAANDAVGFVAARHGGERVLVFGDVFDGGLGLKFQIRRQRPVAEPERAAKPIEIQIEIKNPVVKVRAELFEQMIEVRQAIRLVAVDDKIFFPIGGGVNRLTRNGDAAESHAHELLDEFVVIAGNVNHLRLLAAFAEDFLDEHVVVIAPEPPELQLPAVNEITHEVEIFTVHHAQKFEQFCNVRVPCAEMDVRDPNRTATHRFA